MRTITKENLLRALIVLLLCLHIPYLKASKLYQFRVVDKDYLMLWFYDGEVKFVDDGKGQNAFTNYASPAIDNNYVVNYGDPLDIEKASSHMSYRLISSDDNNYGTEGKNAVNCYRKSKVNGMAEREWLNSVSYNNFGDYNYLYTYEHVIFIKLPHSLQQGSEYSLKLNDDFNADTASINFKYDIFSSRSEAIHVNLNGYSNSSSVKAVDVYMWLGDGGGRDYGAFEGNKVYIYNVETEEAIETGSVSYWRESDIESGYYDYIKADVWNADFTGFHTPGTYRIAIEGIGCSEDFEIRQDIYRLPYQVAVQGFFYMRAGEDSVGISPVPRRPLWLPGEDPANFKVLLTSMNQFHPEWRTFSSGDVWDKPADWDRFVKAGRPENPEAYGGHVDALDWDRHLTHSSIIYDMLLPYLLTRGVIDDDATGIAESGNGIPDLLDEARNEVDFWLRLRDGRGYSHGLTNPSKQNIIYQAAPSAMAAWVNAANSAMLAECFRIGDFPDLMNTYRDSAIAAYEYASTLSNQHLQSSLSIGEDIMKGEDFKMTAAAYLYNLTAEKKYEDVIKELSRVNSPVSQLNKRDNWNQLYAAVAYLLTDNEVNYVTLFKNMKESILDQAWEKEARWSGLRATRRANANNQGYYPTVQQVQRTIVAHAISKGMQKHGLYEDALILEADWSLGRNPANMIQMTTASTELASKRSVINIYTTGRDDGHPGLHPGHTPYFNTNDWACSMIMGCPGKLVNKNYPAPALWPKAELFVETRYVWAHTEFTPHQTMRGKFALYAYLHGIEKLRTEGISIPVKKIELSEDTVFFYPNNRYNLYIQAIPANSSAATILWSSDDERIATITGDGLLMARDIGNTTIRATLPGYDLQDSCYVEVLEIQVPVEDVNILQDSIRIRTGRSEKLDWIILPENVSDTSVTFLSDNTEIATVDHHGNLTAFTEGETYVFIESVNEQKRDSCLIEVVKVPDLLCHLSFDSIQGLNYIDISGNNHDGRAMGGVMITNGRNGKAIELDGKNDYIEIQHSSDFQWNQDQNYSISLWVFPETLRGDWTGIVTKSRDQAPWSGLWINPENKWHSANSIQSSKASVLEKRWYHLVLVQDIITGNQHIYLDGEEIETGPVISETGKGNIWVGGAATTQEFFNGKIDELQIFSIALTTEQIQNLYLMGLGDNHEVEGVLIDMDSLFLTARETADITAEVFPSTAIDQYIGWSVSDPEIASISPAGRVIGLAEGNTEVIAKTRDGDYLESVIVEVRRGTFVKDKNSNKPRLFPNPATEEIKIQANADLLNSHFFIYNPQGEIMQSGTMDDEECCIPIEALKEGVYILQICSDSEVHYSRFIKL
jgi:uncharacterized protein YjdB